MKPMIACPACPVKLQPLESTSSYPQKAMEYAAANGVQVPVHGPAALVFLSLVAHAQLCHPELNLHDYLEAYLSS